MDRSEFLTVLEEALRGEIPDYEIPGHIQYYDGYIREGNGKTEAQRLEELGDPRLIAKTIIDARSQREGSGIPRESFEEAYREDTKEQAGQQTVHYKTYTWDSLAWYQKLLALVILLLVVFVVIVVAGVGLQIFFSVVLPVLAVIVVIRLIISVFR